MSSHWQRLAGRAMSYFLAGIMVMSAFLFNYSVAQAQEAGVETAPTVGTEAVVPPEGVLAEAPLAPEVLPVTADVIPTEVVLDMQVTMQDLGATDATAHSTVLFFHTTFFAEFHFLLLPALQYTP